MDVLRSLLSRLRSVAGPLVMGFVLILYISLAFTLWQETNRQADLSAQVAKLSSVVSKPLAGGKELQERYDEVNDYLAPIAKAEAIDVIIGIAEESGIDVSPEAEKIIVPSPKVSETKVGKGKYQVLSFENITVRGDRDSVMAFMSDLDSGKTLKTMVLTWVAIRELAVESEEGGEPVVESYASVNVDIYFKSQGETASQK